MLKFAIVFLLISILAGALGFTGVAGASAGIAKVLFFLFLLGAIIMLVLGITIFKKIAD